MGVVLEVDPNSAQMSVKFLDTEPYIVPQLFRISLYYMKLVRY